MGLVLVSGEPLGESPLKGRLVQELCPGVQQLLVGGGGLLLLMDVLTKDIAVGGAQQGLPPVHDQDLALRQGQQL